MWLIDLILKLLGRRTVSTPPDPTPAPVQPPPKPTPEPAAPLQAPAPKIPKSGIAAVITAAVLLSTPLTTSFEGFSGKVYYDPAHIATYCYGETAHVDPAIIYSKNQCVTKLRQRMAHDYAPAIAKCAPQIATQQRVKIFAAVLDASYNAGAGGACKSRMVALFKAGQWANGCNAFYGWRTTAHNRQTGQRIILAGLQRRRAAEAALCKEGV